MTALELREVSKDYGSGPAEVRALRGVDLSVGSGELVAIMGPSGSGKSTLLTLAGSLEAPTRGEVLVDGSALAGMSRNDRARLRRRLVGYVFQDFNLLAGLTAVENVALPLELDGVRAKSHGLPGSGRLRSWVSVIGPPDIPTSCQAVKASGWRSLGPWLVVVGCCWRTSRPAPWTRSMARR